MVPSKSCNSHNVKNIPGSQILDEVIQTLSNWKPLSDKGAMKFKLPLQNTWT